MENTQYPKSAFLLTLSYTGVAAGNDFLISSSSGMSLFLLSKYPASPDNWERRVSSRTSYQDKQL
ncbi:MAG: hypothetical protein IPO37_03545 [Saprospiraceae bacterium]|nr:hypothetical protein [Saprospiraceae bacterium]